MIDTYTRLLEAVIKRGDPKIADEAVNKLVAHLKSAGRMNMLPQIARELRKIVARRDSLRPKVEVADKKDSVAALAAAAQNGIHAANAAINPTLIRGWRAREGDRLFDASAKRALVEIYRKSVS